MHAIARERENRRDWGKKKKSRSAIRTYTCADSVHSIIPPPSLLNPSIFAPQIQTSRAADAVKWCNVHALGDVTLWRPVPRLANELGSSHSNCLSCSTEAGGCEVPPYVERPRQRRGYRSAAPATVEVGGSTFASTAFALSRRVSLGPREPQLHAQQAQQLQVLARRGCRHEPADCSTRWPMVVHVRGRIYPSPGTARSQTARCSFRSHASVAAMGCLRAGRSRRGAA